jgi:Glycosyltransferase family 87
MPVTADQTQIVSATPTSIDKGFIEPLLASLGAAVLVFFVVLWTANGPRLEKIDFSVTYLGARMVHDGRGAQLYDLTEQIKLRSELYRDPNPLIYEHPPFEALLLSPLAAFPYKTAYLIWGLLNAVIWLGLPFLLRPYVPVPKNWIVYLALWMIFAPLGVALFQGQSSLILLLCYALAYIFGKKRKELLAGICLGLGLFKFQFVIPFALVLLLRKKWRFVGGIALCAAVFGLLSLVAVGWSGSVSYAHFLLSIGSNPQNVSYGSAVDMPTLHGFAYALLGRLVGGKFLSVIVAACSLSLIVFTAVRWSRAERGGKSADLAFAAAIVVSLMTGLHMFTHDFSPLMLALLICLASLPQSPTLRWSLRALVAVFFFPPVYFALIVWHKMFLMFMAMIGLWCGMQAGIASERG